MTHLKPSPALLLLLPLLLSVSQPAAALQILHAREGDTVLGKISQKEVTRIRFEHGRIRKITGNAGEFVLEKDEEKGQIFIRPVSPESTKPINLFLTSERSTVALLLQPVDTPSDTLVIRETRDPMKSITPMARSGLHVRTLKNLLLVMVGDTLPDDMVVRESGQELTLWPGVRLTLQRSWLGAGIVGEKYQLVNTGRTDVNLTERDLYKPGVMAVSLEHASLPPGNATNLFVIRER